MNTGAIRVKLLSGLALGGLCLVVLRTVVGSAPGSLPGVLPSLRGEAFHRAVAQEEERAGEDTAEVPPEQVNKYIKVYDAMQHDRSLTVEQAAQHQGLSLESFRTLEQKIEHDDMLRDRVRQRLQESAEKQTGKAKRHAPAAGDDTGQTP